MFSQLARRKGHFFALFFILVSHHGASAEEKPCTAHADGKYYDLNPLKASKDYEIKTPNNETLTLNVCQNVRTDTWGIKDESIIPGDVGGFILREHGMFVFGKVNTAIQVFDGQPRFVMSDGSRCKPRAGGQDTDIRASALVQFICDMASFQGSPRLLAQLPPGDNEIGCAYLIEWKTHYACPTTEGGGVWGFFAIMAVIFLALLITYTVLGTLYNRFVLQLRGFDQIPQFSIESMKYHSREAIEWIQDIVAGLDIGGRGSGASGGSYTRPSSGSVRTPNPFSHQSQVSGFGGPEDIEEGAALAGGLGGGNGFIRPQRGTSNRPAAFQRSATNPVSHQSQVIAQSLASPGPQSPSPSVQEQSAPPLKRDMPSARRFGSDTRATLEERDFMLGDDDEDAEELGDVHTFSRPTPEIRITPSNSSESHQGSASPQNVPSSATPTTEPNPAAAARGRDLGDGDVIRL